MNEGAKVFHRIARWSIDAQQHGVAGEPFPLTRAEAWELTAYLCLSGSVRCRGKRVKPDVVIDSILKGTMELYGCHLLVI